MILPILNTFVLLLIWMNGMRFRTLYCKQKNRFMTGDIIIFNDFLKRFGIYREFCRELRLAQPGLSWTKNKEVELPDDCPPKDYITRFFNWNRTRRGPFFWSLMDDVWREYYSKNL